MLDLQRFCALGDDPRDYLKKPWHDGGWMYATNGHICIRVPFDGSSDVVPRDKHPNAAALFEKWRAAKSSGFEPLPPLAAGTECGHCKGQKVFKRDECESCKGEGVFVWHGLQYDCKWCESEPVGAGYVVNSDGALELPCQHCWGRGLEMQEEPLGESRFELAYLQWCAELPGITYRTHGQEGAALLPFNGGEVLLMPRRF